MQYDPLKSIQNAWLKRLLDFRAWFMPNSALMSEWKFKDYKSAIRACRATMMDDAEAMIEAYRNNDNTDATGTTAILPIILTATALIDQPPNTMQLMPAPYFVPVLFNDKRCKMRLSPSAVRAQIAVFATNPHDARAVGEQFCAYMTDDNNRKFQVNFQFSDSDFSDFPAMILENELFPNPVPSEAKNLSIVVIDATILCHVPHIVGLDGTIDTGNGIDDSGTPITVPTNDLVVVQADQHETEPNEQHHRVYVDPNTEEKITETNVDGDPFL